MSKFILNTVFILTVLELFYCNKVSRLPNHVIPEKYDLKIISHLCEGGSNDFTYCGEVYIKVKCVESTKRITLHANKLKITDTKVFVGNENGKCLKVNQVTKEPKYDFLHICLDKPLQEHKCYTIHIKFSGDISDCLTGFYRSSYKEGNKKKWMASTHLEPFFARSVFPCFDEPALRATFKISLGHKDKYTSVSNMPLSCTKRMAGANWKGWVLDVFKESPRMSTYAVAFVISEFDYKTCHSNNKTIQVGGRPDAKCQFDFALAKAKQGLKFFNDYFCINYPLCKLSLIAIPDFLYEGSGSLGLTLFRESSLLVDQNVSPSLNTMNTASLICHEIAHQWHGNIVTMKWWSNVWLKEGISQYFEKLCMHDLYPAISIDALNQNDLNSVYLIDSLLSSHPVSMCVDCKYKIRQIFDVITYQKGLYLTRMMGLSFGENVLKRGINRYLNKHQYENTIPDDLWCELTKEAHKTQTLSAKMTVGKIMNPWIEQTGYPVVTVTRHYKTGQVTICQKRYFQNSEIEDDDTCWWVPITYTTKCERDFRNTKPKLWLPCPKRSVTIYYNQPNKWIIFNIRQAGLYRVNYDENNWKMLIEQVNEEPCKIGVMNVVGLINDIFAFAKSDHICYNLAFRMIRFLPKTRDMMLWKAVVHNLNDISYLLRRTEGYKVFQRYIDGIIRITSRQLSMSQKSSIENFITDVTCAYDQEKCIQATVKLYKSHKNSICSNSQYTVYCSLMKSCSENEWDNLWRKYLNSNVASEKVTILLALACSRKESILKRYLDKIFMRNCPIRQHDIITIFVHILKNIKGYVLARNFFYKNIQVIHNVLKPSWINVPKILDGISKYIICEKEYREMKAFLGNNQQYFKEVKIGVDQALEKAKLNVCWHNKHYKTVIGVLMKEIQYCSRE